MINAYYLDENWDIYTIRCAEGRNLSTMSWTQNYYFTWGETLSFGTDVIIIGKTLNFKHFLFLDKTLSSLVIRCSLVQYVHVHCGFYTMTTRFGVTHGSFVRKGLSMKMAICFPLSILIEKIFWLLVPVPAFVWANYLPYDVCSTSSHMPCKTSR